MPGGNPTFSPPVQFSPLWFALGIGIILLVIGFYVLALVFTRRRRNAPTATDGPPSQFALQQGYLGRIDAIAHAHARGTLTPREAHQQLSAVVREYVERSRGLPAPYLTLDELRERGLDPLSDTIGALYPGEFGPEPVASVAASADRARWLVSAWR